MDVREWRKRALDGELPDFGWMAADPVGFLKVLQNVYTSCIGKGPRHHLAGVRLILTACEVGVRSRELAVRKPAVYLLHDVTSLLASDYEAGMPGLISADLLDWAESGLCDPGTDLDERGRPVQAKGTLTLAQRAEKILSRQPVATSNARRFDGALAGLERVDAWIMHDLLDPGYSRKLVDHLLHILESLLKWGEPLPEDALPRFIRFTGNTEFERIPLEPLMGLLRQASRRREYVRPFIAAAGTDPNIADVVWGLFRRELEAEGDNARSIRQGLEQTGAPYPFTAATS